MLTHPHLRNFVFAQVDTLKMSELLLKYQLARLPKRTALSALSPKSVETFFFGGEKQSVSIPIEKIWFGSRVKFQL